MKGTEQIKYIQSELKGIPVFHGGEREIKTPEIRKSKYPADFGVGFYCTNIEKQAIKWSKRSLTPVVCKYRFELQGNMKYKFFHQNDEWLDFITACRTGKPHDYDVVEGPMANDQVWNFVDDFVLGLISREAFWYLAKFKYPTHQICFCTQESLQCLLFEGSKAYER